MSDVVREGVYHEFNMKLYSVQQHLDIHQKTSKRIRKDQEHRDRQQLFFRWQYHQQLIVYVTSADRLLRDIREGR